MSKTRSVLAPERQSLLPGLGCSALLHGGVLLTGLSFSLVTANCGPRRPIVDLDQTMEVSLIARTDLKVPERASRAPVPKGRAEVTEDAPVEAPREQSDLVFEKEEAEETEGTDTDRQDALDEIERQRMLEQLMNAPDGTVDRAATDPNGTGDVTLNPGLNARGDPEYAAYIAKVQAIFLQHFQPLGAIVEQNPNLSCKVLVRVDEATMRVLSYEVVQSSGIPAYDAAAERAAAAVTALPPPPERYRSLLADGYTMNFRPK